MLFAYNLLAKKMALIYRYIGDVPNSFEVLTDGVRVPNAAGTMVIPDSFHVTEVRDISFFDVVNNMNIIEEEITRRELRDLAENNGYQMIEFDDAEELTTLHDPPRITTYNPTRGGEIAAITSNIVLTFSENIAKAAATGPVVQLINLTTNVLIETFAFDSSLITVSTTQATINPTSNLVLNNEYALLIGKGYFTNTGATEDHGGIHALNFYNFTTPAS